MMANDVSIFLSFYLQLTIAGFILFILEKPRFVEDVLFYPWNEVMAFPKIKIKWDWVSDVHVYIKSDFDSIVVREPVKPLRIKLRTANLSCK